MRDDVGMSLDVAEGGTAWEGKGVHTDTVSNDLGVIATGPDFPKSWK